jgi:hypothetical protein
MDLLGAEEVFLNLVVDDAVARFLDGKSREGFGLSRCGGGHGINDGVDALLAEFSELGPGVFCATSERTRFGN